MKSIIQKFLCALVLSLVAAFIYYVWSGWVLLPLALFAVFATLVADEGGSRGGSVG